MATNTLPQTADSAASFLAPPVPDNVVHVQCERETRLLLDVPELAHHPERARAVDRDAARGMLWSMAVGLVIWSALIVAFLWIKQHR